MASNDKTNLLVEIEANFDGLSPQLKVAARYILSSPDDVAVYSMREIASRASVQPSTMLRLANKLDYGTYNDFRDAFRKRLSAPSTGYAARARSLQMRQTEADGNSLISEMVEAEQYNIQTTFDQVADEDFSSVATRIVNAETLYIVGLRKCFSLATFFHYATRVFVKRAHLVTGAAGMFREEISQINKDDVVLAIAFDPYTFETVEAVKVARAVGATIVVVTDSNVSPLARDADHAFIAANRSPSFYRSLSGALMILQTLIAAIVTELGEPAVKALDGSDQRLRDHQTYWKN